MNRFVGCAAALAVLVSLSFVGSVVAGEKKKKLREVTLKIDGGGCEVTCEKLDKELTSLKGVVKGKSCSASNLTKVKFDASQVKMKQVLGAFKKAGVKVEGQQLVLAVDGMSCGACSSKVNKRLASLEGVVKGEACHASDKATVLFCPLKLKEKEVVAAIQAAGFKVAKMAPEKVSGDAVVN